MNWTTELPFRLDGVEGDLKIVYNPFFLKLYQNGQEIKRIGFPFAEQKYMVKTTDGDEQLIIVSSNTIGGKEINYKEETIKLEKSLSGLTLALSFLPFIFIGLSFFLMYKGIALLEVALFFGCGILAMTIIGNVLRKESSSIKKIFFAIGISVSATIISITLAIILGTMLGLFIKIAFFTF